MAEAPVCWQAPVQALAESALEGARGALRETEGAAQELKRKLNGGWADLCRHLMKAQGRPEGRIISSSNAASLAATSSGAAYGDSASGGATSHDATNEGSVRGQWKQERGVRMPQLAPGSPQRAPEGSRDTLQGVPAGIHSTRGTLGSCGALSSCCTPGNPRRLHDPQARACIRLGALRECRASGALWGSKLGSHRERVPACSVACTVEGSGLAPPPGPLVLPALSLPLALTCLKGDLSQFIHSVSGTVAFLLTSLCQRKTLLMTSLCEQIPWRFVSLAAGAAVSACHQWMQRALLLGAACPPFASITTSHTRDASRRDALAKGAKGPLVHSQAEKGSEEATEEKEGSELGQASAAADSEDAATAEGAEGAKIAGSMGGIRALYVSTCQHYTPNIFTSGYTFKPWNEYWTYLDTGEVYLGLPHGDPRVFDFEEERRLNPHRFVTLEKLHGSDIRGLHYGGNFVPFSPRENTIVVNDEVVFRKVQPSKGLKLEGTFFHDAPKDYVESSEAFGLRGATSISFSKKGTFRVQGCTNICFREAFGTAQPVDVDGDSRGVYSIDGNVIEFQYDNGSIEDAFFFEIPAANRSMISINGVTYRYLKK